MDYFIKTPDQMTMRDIDQLVHLAGIGFGQGDTPEMYQDTMEHLRASEQTQMLYNGHELAAFAMTRRCLWRPSN